MKAAFVAVLLLFAPAGEAMAYEEPVYEVVRTYEEFEVRRYASQGQHRTFGMALKLAQYFYLYDRLEEAPILLLDDVFDTLDAQRMQAFLALLQSDAVGQSIITAAQHGSFNGMVRFDAPEHQIAHVVAGAVENGLAASS